MKIVIIGASSRFGGRLSVDIISREVLRDATICLVDIHPSRLKKVLGYVQHTIDRGDSYRTVPGTSRLALERSIEANQLWNESQPFPPQLC